MFKEIVNHKIFAARNLDDVLLHELDGHKRHWDSIKTYAKDRNIGIVEAKNIFLLQKLWGITLMPKFK